MSLSYCQIYTSICGDKDKARNDIKVITYDRFVDPRLNAKIAKIMPHLFMDCEYSVWMDGNMYPSKPESDYIKLLAGNDIAVLAHPERNTIYDEAEFCKIKGKDKKENIDPQIKRYENVRGLYSCGFIVRRHTEKMKRLCERWWAEICVGSVRDQISFPYVFQGVPITVLDKNVWANDLYQMDSHNK